MRRRRHLQEKGWVLPRKAAIGVSRPGQLGFFAAPAAALAQEARHFRSAGNCFSASSFNSLHGARKGPPSQDDDGIEVDLLRILVSAVARTDSDDDSPRSAVSFPLYPRML